MVSRMLTLNELFNADFLNALKQFRLFARQVERDGRPAEHKSKALGHGLEFKDFRPYAPGDDLRSVDWNIYRRLGKLFVRVSEEQQDLPVYLMPDVSKSMYLGENPRINAAMRVSLALSYTSLNQHDSVGLFPFAEDMQIKLRSKSGKSNLMSLARHLSELRERHTTDLAASLNHLSSIKVRRGLLIIISDFFDPGGVQAIEAALRSVRHRLLFVQLVRKDDAEPDLEGNMRLRDCETSGFADISVTPDLLKRYQTAYQAFNTELAQLAKKKQATLVQIDVEEDIVQQLSSLFRQGGVQV
ncbi:DUF58 domain-containing protein [Porticoccus sp. W117]|uniref:DUF58 domain-containing protein n=1 Tax=Porticoccus sp. W117 TaxID=3054777 RepID=UPI002598A273|nr:DUF58 domain-containing protein [Porticoccus sp. W117]MDM3872151.1 DUF58 domain-containing protein [Porticoccus sp. W117]